MSTPRTSPTHFSFSQKVLIMPETNMSFGIIPKIPKALTVGPDSFNTALAKCKRLHEGVQTRAKEEVERRAFMKQIWQMEQAEREKTKANKKALKAKTKMLNHRRKTKEGET